MKEFEWTAKKLGAAAIITDERGYILMVKHSYGKLNWEIPGGAAEANESIADTAIREVHEETGLVVIAERLTGTYFWADNDSHHFVFLCSIVQDGQKPLSLSGETTGCGFFPADALPRPISDFTVRRIRDALSEQTALLPVTVGPRQWLD